ncbi:MULTISPECIES: ABC transporter ATP-binding protein [Inquilinus]|uniref:Iron(III) transport system ATP-binding protein n=1 Tax=Inquilinus ginsengisoli TaxID=363840 RepID=A0ABU1JQ10_9PROT|nr:ABC transporter ATP-binding protein [Inquilinus ginsengisoli]MDR6290702.1 iron(III) transport system ATP-binding protein [Inquilinus ginsengisoli]
MTRETKLNDPARAGDPAPGLPAVEFRTVSKRYGAVAAVDRIGFTIERGTLVTLLGPSGCGKTTTLRLIAGLELASEGRILIDGEDVTHRSAAERDVSMVFQSYALFPHMSVMDNVCYGLRASGIKQARAEAMAAEKLAAVGLSGFERRLPSELSGGQQQRVAVARAIVLEPKVLLFDEPLSNLDAKLRRRVREDIRGLQQALGLTVVYVTHDQEEALAVSDRIVVMHSARIVQDGTPRDLYERPANRFIADFIGNANLLPVTVQRQDGAMARVALGGATLQLPHRDLPAGAFEIAVRPQAIRLRAGGPQPGELGGVIRKAAYLGSHMEYQVELMEIGTEAFVIDGDVGTPLAPGTAVGVAITADGAALVPADEAA